MDMKEKIRHILKAHGADACGIAGVERFDGAPGGFHPRDIYPDCRAAIVFLKRMPLGLKNVSPRIAYYHTTEINIAAVDHIAYEASLALERGFSISAVPIPCDSPYEHWEEENKRGCGILSMRHAAMLAGLGHLGKNTLLIHPDFGNMVNIGVILTDVELPSDPILETSCAKGCSICLDACPQHALDGVTVNQKLCRSYTYTQNARGFSVCNCNRCRVLCPLSAGRKHTTHERVRPSV